MFRIECKIFLDRVYAVITFTMVQIGYSMALIPDYSKAKKAALRIMELNQQPTKIDPHDESGIILVFWIFMFINRKIFN